MIQSTTTRNEENALVKHMQVLVNNLDRCRHNVVVFLIHDNAGMMMLELYD